MKTVIFILIAAFMVALTICCEAGEVKLTTYYPAPYGEYDTIKTKKDTYLATDANAKVGIGTTTPETLLQVGGDSQTVASNGQITIAKSNGLGTAARKFRIGLDNNYNLSIGDFGYWADDTYTSFMTIGWETGNVGIGTINPSAKFSVVNESLDTGPVLSTFMTRKAADGLGLVSTRSDINIGRWVSLGINTGNGSWNPITRAGDRAIVYGGPGGTSLNPNTTGGLVIVPWRNDSGSNGIRLDAKGNVGIWTHTPGYQLDVSGITRNTSGTWIGSDLRWKKNIETLPVSTLSKVLKLRGVKFDWRRKEFKDKNFSEGKQIGMIAQEVEKEFPELINTDNEGYKNLAYEKFTAVLLEAIKEQQKEIDILKQKVGT